MEKLKDKSEVGIMKNEQKNETDRQMMDNADEQFLQSLKQGLQQTAEPPAQIDSFIKAAARQRLKKNSRTQKKLIFFWSGSIAAALAVSFSFIYFTSVQEGTPGAEYDFQQIATTQDFSAQSIANNKITNNEQTNIAWTDVLTEISELSSDFNEADLDIAAVSAWDMGYSALNSLSTEKHQ